MDRDPAGVDHLVTAVQRMWDVGMRMLRVPYQGHVAEALEAHDRIREAARACDEGLATSEITGERLHLPELLRLRGRYAASLGEEWQPWLERAIAVADEQGTTRLAALATRELTDLS
ncbi:hypothetical protein [Euzebya sp.]|uniref:hypothetical protein n=1 Tax=Euzebya sp. TaxID=1971409 RepID=UPI003512AB01